VKNNFCKGIILSQVSPGTYNSAAFDNGSVALFVGRVEWNVKIVALALVAILFTVDHLSSPLLPGFDLD